MTIKDAYDKVQIQSQYCRNERMLKQLNEDRIGEARLNGMCIAYEEMENILERVMKDKNTIEIPFNDIKDLLKDIKACRYTIEDMQRYKEKIDKNLVGMINDKMIFVNETIDDILDMLNEFFSDHSLNTEELQKKEKEKK